jgi:hypothetical protein
LNITRKVTNKTASNLGGRSRKETRERLRETDTLTLEREREREREREEGKIETRRNGKKPQYPNLTLIDIPFVLKSNSPQKKKLLVPKNK